jgi:hypothetical protein
VVLQNVQHVYGPLPALSTLLYDVTGPKDKISSVPLCMFDKIVGDKSKVTTRLLQYTAHDEIY